MNNMFKNINEYEKEYCGVNQENIEKQKLFVPSNQNASSDIAFLVSNLSTNNY